MKADARQWIDIVGCASYIAPASGIIDADTVQAANRLKEMVAEMQNTVFVDDHDAYHDICDEPPMPGTQDYEDSKGDYICHQKRDE